MRAIFGLTTFTITLAATFHPAGAQQLDQRDRWADSARREIETAVVRGDAERLGAARTLLERALVAFPGDPLLLHYTGYALYREATLLQDPRERARARSLLEQADSALEQSAAMPMPETHALRSAVLGQLIGVSRSRLAAMRLGPHAAAQMDRALELGPENPRVWLLRGTSAIFTPKLWGGGTERAEQYLRKALALYAADHPAPPMPAWGHADAYAWLGQVYQRQGKRDAARAVYGKALEIQPENQWVRHRLLPGLDQPTR